MLTPPLFTPPLHASTQRFLDLQSATGYSFYPVNDFRDLREAMRSILQDSLVGGAGAGFEAWCRVLTFELWSRL